MESQDGEREAQAPGWPVGGGEMGALVRAHDWAATPLGPLDAWPGSLHTATDTALACAFPMIVLWGPDLVQVYNDGYRALMGVKHPAGLGQPTRDCWPEVWHINAPIYERVWAGETLTFEDALYPITRSGALEDAWFTLCYSPLHDESGAIAGVLVTVFETTERHVAEIAREEGDQALRASEERQAFLLRLSDALRPLTDPVAIQGTATHVLGAHLDVDRTYYVEIDDTRQVAVVERDYVRGAVPSLVGEHPLAPFGSMLAVIQAGRTFVAADAETDPALRAELADYRARALRAFVTVPLVKDGALVAAMCVTSAAPRRWTDVEVSLVEETAERTWAALERGRAEAGLHASEARFRSFAEASADTLWIVDAATQRLEYLSPAFERMWGEPRDAILRDLGRWAELVHPADRDQASRVLPRALAGEAVVADYRIVRPSDGAVRWIRDTGFPIRDAAGRVGRVAGIAQDITDQKAAEAALREERATLERRVAARTEELAAAVENLRASEGRLRLLLEQMPAALWTTDRDLHVTALTGAAVPALPASPRDGVDRPVSDLFAFATPAALSPLADPDGDTPPVAAHRRALAGASSGFDVEIDNRTYEAHVEALRDPEGRIVGTIGVTHDVSERALLRLQDEFLALASHELRTPLTPALGYLDMLPDALAADDPSRAARYAALARGQVALLASLVGDLLDVGRLRAGQLHLDSEEIDLAAVARRAVEAARVEAGAQGQTIALRVPAAPIRLRGDARRLQQVALNLLINAVRYAPHSETIDVRLRRDARAREAVLTVGDDGPGIAEAELPHLFSRFYQVARPDRPARGGLGLGLYLVKELVEAHGGAVAVTSALGQGATFTVRLPLAGVDAAGPARR